jgi:hypothetical protein
MAVMAAGAVGGYFGGRTAAAGHRSLGAMFGSSRFAKAPSTTRGFPMRLIALILSSGIALASIPASASIGKQHIQSNKRQRQHLPRGRGTCRMRRLSFDF